MAILKIFSKKPKSRKAQYNVMAYVGKKAELMFGYGCDQDWYQANKDFQTIQLLSNSLNRKNSRYAQHWCLSFERENNSPEKTMEMAKEFVEKALGKKDIQVFIAVHTDQQNSIHAHLVLNNVNYHGKKLQTTKRELDKFKKLQNEIALEHGLKVLELGSQKEKETGKKRNVWKSQNYHRDKQMSEYIGAILQEVKRLAEEKQKYNLPEIMDQQYQVMKENFRYKKVMEKSIAALQKDKEFYKDIETYYLQHRSFDDEDEEITKKLEMEEEIPQEKTKKLQQEQRRNLWKKKEKTQQHEKKSGWNTRAGAKTWKEKSRGDTGISR